MIKVTFIGAGSTVFMKNILTDILLEKNYKLIQFNIDSINKKFHISKFGKNNKLL